MSDQIAYYAAIVGLLSPFIGLLGVWIGHFLTAQSSKKQQEADRFALAESFFTEIWSLGRLIALMGAAANSLLKSPDRLQIEKMVLNLPEGEPVLFGALASELRRLDTQTRTVILSFYTVLGSIKAHTRSLPDIASQKTALSGKYVHDVVAGWRRVAGVTSAALAHIDQKYRTKLPEHEQKYIKQMLCALEAVAAGKADDPDKLATSLANLP